MKTRVKIRVKVNGETTEKMVESRLLLVDYLREELGLTGTHVGCDTSNCGACTVILDGRAVKSCTVLAVQAASFIENIPGYLARLQALLTDPSRPWLNNLVSTGFPDLQASAFFKDAAAASVVFLKSLWSGGQAVASLVSLFVIAPVVAFYVLLDWNRMVAAVDRWLPREHAGTIRALAREIDTAVAGFVRGQTLVSLVLGACYVAGFLAVGLHFGLLIGILTGLASFIPYVGTFAGMVVALLVAVLQFWPDWMPIAGILAVGVVCGALESYVLSPYLVGPSVGLHPVWLMFALLTFAYLFGFLGLIVAIPVSAAVGVLVRFALRQYLASRVYTGERIS